MFVYSFSKSRDKYRTKGSEDASENKKSDDDENQIHVFCFVGKINRLIIFDIFVEFISIVSKECSDETAHIGADDNQQEEDDIQDKFDRKIMSHLKFNREIDDQKRNSYEEN